MSTVFTLIILNIISMIIIFIYVENDSLKPTKLTFIFLISMLIVWISFIGGIFTLVPTEFVDLLWNACWIYLIFAGLAAIIFEVKNSRLYVIVALLLTSINFIFFSFSIPIGNM
ncbi:hypothetical protein [Solibacillus sp. FSL W7-1324]|uniref:hypothetical protein n=1 Tax=Solibacillus sp. FSL W7-1324 TaxID=2921701 RepID=UPI0030F8E002